MSRSRWIDHHHQQLLDHWTPRIALLNHHGLVPSPGLVAPLLGPALRSGLFGTVRQSAASREHQLQSVSFSGHWSFSLNIPTIETNATIFHIQRSFVGRQIGHGAVSSGRFHHQAQGGARGELPRAYY